MSRSSRKLKSITELQSLVRAGDFPAVVNEIQNMNRKKIPRLELVQYANIANRVDQGRLSYRLLHPLIRSSTQVNPATSEEKIEYAEALRGMGLIDEAIRLLKEIDAKTFPLADLRIAFCLMTQWRYAEAIPYLRSYIASNISQKEGHEYLILVAQVNLAASLVITESYSEALELLNSLINETQAAGHQLLQGNCLELLAQLYVRQGQCDLADQILEEAETFFGEIRSRFALYWRKWRAISKSIRIAGVHPELLQCREIAIRDQEWETLRECDLYIGCLTKNQELLDQVYFGTPHESYRNRILNLTAKKFQPSGTFTWRQEKGEPLGEVFDLLKGKFESGTAALESGHLMHQMLFLLVRDFYRPLSIGSAFSALFPDENYSQSGSANRIYQIIMRLRAWLEENGNLMSIEESDGAYRLKIKGGVGIRIPLEKPGLSSEEISWIQLKSRLESETFTRNDVIELLRCSQASANRLLRWFLKTGKAEIIGGGAYRKYRFLNVR